MRHRKRTARFNRLTEHRLAMLSNQVCSLILTERIATTVAKAKETKRFVDKLVTLGKSGTLHHRRLAISRIGNRAAVSKLFSDIAPRFMEREGGYTRIIRLGTRRGDGAETCYLEFVEAGTPADRQTRADRAAEKVAPVAAAEAAAPAEAAAEQKQD